MASEEVRKLTFSIEATKNTPFKKRGRGKLNVNGCERKH